MKVIKKSSNKINMSFVDSWWFKGIIAVLITAAIVTAACYIFPSLVRSPTNDLFDALKGTKWTTDDGQVTLEFGKDVDPSSISVGDDDKKLSVDKQLSMVWTAGGITLNSSVLGQLKMKADAGFKPEEKIGGFAWDTRIKDDKTKMALFNNDDRYLKYPFAFLVNTKENTMTVRLYNVLFDYHKNNKGDPSVLALKQVGK